MQAGVIDEMTKVMADGKGHEIPYSVQMSLSMFLGQDLAASLEPKNIAAMQLTILGDGKEQAKNEADQAIKVSQAGLSHLSLSQRSQTNLQSISGRGDA
jgi:hypothetical protein